MNRLDSVPQPDLSVIWITTKESADNSLAILKDPVKLPGKTPKPLIFMKRFLLMNLLLLPTVEVHSLNEACFVFRNHHIDRRETMDLIDFSLYTRSNTMQIFAPCLKSSDASLAVLFHMVLKNSQPYFCVSGFEGR
jgi:hypothetical protein